jgi:hypothetical protein
MKGDNFSYGEDDPRSRESQVHYKLAVRLSQQEGHQKPKKTVEPVKPSLTLCEENARKLSVGCF